MTNMPTKQKNVNYMPTKINNNMTNIQKVIEESKEKNEIAVFGDEIASSLPKSFERSALGDEKIYRAFSIAYPKMRKYIISNILSAIEKEVERKKKMIPPFVSDSTESMTIQEVTMRTAYNSAISDIQSLLKSANENIK